MEAEANYAAGQLLFLADRFREEASGSAPSLAFVKSLSKGFGNTMTSTLWRLVEQAHGVALPLKYNATVLKALQNGMTAADAFAKFGFM